MAKISGWGAPRAGHTHEGIDWSAPIGSTLTTNQGGVVKITDGGISGLAVRVTYPDGTSTVYRHLDSVAVQNGQTVDAGTVLGTTGRTGNADGTVSHVHTEARDANNQAVDQDTSDKFTIDGKNPNDTATTRVNEIKDGYQEQYQSDKPTQGASGEKGLQEGNSKKGSGCASAGAAGLLSIAAAGLFGGFGLSGVFSGLTSALAPLNSALSAVGGIGTVAQAGIALATGGGPIAALSVLGAGIAPALGGVIPAAMAVASGNINAGTILSLGGGLVGGDLGQAMTVVGGIAGLAQAVGNSMSGNFKGGNLGNFMTNMYAAQAATALSKDIVAGTADSMQQYFGGGPNGIGININNNDNLVTYGASAISNNLPLFGSDMVKAGTWDARNMTRFMQPANIAAQIIAEGYGDDRTGLIAAVINKDIPIGQMDGAIYDKDCLTILASITKTKYPDGVKAIKDHWKMQIELDNLAQLADMKYMLPNAYPTLTVKTWFELALKLIDIQVTRADTIDAIGHIFWGLERVMDLNNVAQMPTPFHKPSGDLILKTFGYGSGSYGELTMADFLGTAAGYVHEDTFPVLIDNMKYLLTRNESKQYRDGATFLLHLAQGKYTSAVDTPSGGDPSSGTVTYTYTVPYNEPGYTNGFIGTFEDTRIYTSTSTGTTTNTGLTEAVLALIPYIEEGMRTLANSTDPDIKAAMEAMDKAHAASCAQIIREAHLLELFQIKLFNTDMPYTPMYALSFLYGIQNQAEETGHGMIADYVNRICTTDLYGDSIRALLRMQRNGKKMEQLGVSIDRFNLPISGYYREPLGLMTSMYDGMVPQQATYNAPVRFPTDPVQQYIATRDAKLVDSGYTSYMTPEEKEIAYAESYWGGYPPFILQQIGEHVARSALDRNMFIIGNELIMIDLAGNRVKLGNLTKNALTDFNAGAFIDIMFSIINRILYGNITLNRNNNQFLTDQIVYALAEMFGNIDSTNVLTLVETYLGQNVMADIIQRLARKFSNQTTVFDTSMDRNRNGAYGGPGSVPDTRIT